MICRYIGHRVAYINSLLTAAVNLDLMYTRTQYCAVRIEYITILPNLTGIVPQSDLGATRVVSLCMGVTIVLALRQFFWNGTLTELRDLKIKFSPCCPLGLCLGS